MSQGLRLALLGIWAGMLLAIGAVAIPAAFQTLPGTELSARLVGAALPTLDQAGIVLALAAVAVVVADTDPITTVAIGLFVGETTALVTLGFAPSPHSAA